MGQGAVARRVGLDFGAIQADGAQLEQLHLLRDVENLNKQLGQFAEKTSTKCRQGVVVWMRASCDKPEGHRVVGRPLYSAAGKHARGIAVDEQRQQQRWMIGRAAAPTIGVHH